MEWINLIIQGILVGGLYTLYATGLSLMFGVMRFVNTAHGDFIVLSAYLVMVLLDLGVPPFLGIAIALIVMGGMGYLLQKTLFGHVVEKGHGATHMIVLTIGISIIIQNLLLEFFTADSQRVQAGEIEVMSMNLGHVSIGLFPLLIFLSAVLLIGGLELLFYRTRIGIAFRAVSDNKDIAQLMGIDHHKLYGYATALVFIAVTIAGLFLSVQTNFDPTIGPGRLIYAFEVVIIGGIGNLWGTLVGGVTLGVAQALGAAINPGFQALAGHLVFLLILIFRPSGLLKARTVE